MSRHPTHQTARAVFYRGFRIDREDGAGYNPATGHYDPTRYYINGGGQRRYRARSLDDARQTIDAALDPLTPGT
jgi:hypothetical protein